MKKFFLFAFLGFIAAVSSCTKEMGPLDKLDCNNLDHTYSTGIKAIIDTKCAISGCHVMGYVPGVFEDYSGIYEKYTSGALELRLFTIPTMPPANQVQLTPEERQQFRCWMDKGAPNN